MDALRRIAEQVRAAHAVGRPLRLRGGGTKDFYGQPPAGELLDLRDWRGIEGHEPSELVVSARAGTPLVELETALAEHGQCLAFEPPHFGDGATVGGMVAAGLSGPARASAGALRDHVLGATLMNGAGELLRFGGRVMKNVAGYDVSRALAGSLGTLGVIVDVSLKVMPLPAASASLRFECDLPAALERLNRWAGMPLPVHASAWHAGVLHVRLSGARSAVGSACRALGGRAVDDHEARALWQALREQTHLFFAPASQGSPLWRLSLPQTAPALALRGDTLVEWGGAQRWLFTDETPAAVRAAAQAARGHATLFRRGDGIAAAVPSFTPPDPVQARIQRALKAGFDPASIFNPGRLNPDW